MLDHFVETAANPPHSLGVRYFGAVRRHLAIVDQSQLRADCLKLALSMQPRRWQVVDIRSVSDLVQRLRHGEGFDVILLGQPVRESISSTLALWLRRRRIRRSSWRRIAKTRSGPTRSSGPARAVSCRRHTASKF